MTVKWQIMQGIAGVALFAIAVAIEPREISDQVFLAQGLAILGAFILGTVNGRLNAARQAKHKPIMD